MDDVILTPKEIYQDFFTKDFIQGKSRKSFNIYTDRDAFGLFLMIIKLNNEFNKSEWGEEKETYWTNHFTSFSFTIDPTTVTKILYPTDKKPTDIAQYKKIRKLFTKLTDADILIANTGETNQRITSYDLNWFGVFKLLLKFIHETGHSERTIEKYIAEAKGTSFTIEDINDDKRFHTMQSYAKEIDVVGGDFFGAHFHFDSDDEDASDELASIALPHEGILNFIEDYYQRYALRWTYQNDLDRDALSFANSFIIMASRYRLETERIIRKKIFELIDEGKEIPDFLRANVQDILSDAHTERSKHDYELAYFLAFFDLLANSDEDYFGYEAVENIMRKTSKDVLHKFNANLFKKDLLD